MRYYLDTNILIFIKTGRTDELSSETRELLDDYGNLFYTSSVCVHEFIHLCQIGKVTINSRRKHSETDGLDVLPWLEEAGIEVRPVTEKHLAKMAALPLRRDHHDPFDRLIIAQAIADGVSVITSDRQFAHYRRQGLGLVFNER